MAETTTRRSARGSAASPARKMTRTPEVAVLRALQILDDAADERGEHDPSVYFHTPTEIQRVLNQQGYMVKRSAVSNRMATLARAGKVEVRAYTNTETDSITALNRAGYRYALLRGDRARDLSQEMEALRMHAQGFVARVDLRPERRRKRVQPGHISTQLELRAETNRRLQAAAAALGVDRAALADQLIESGLRELNPDSVHTEVQQRYPSISHALSASNA